MPDLIFFQKEILKYYRRHGRAHLPWRRVGISAYEVWVSEIMLQQTQVERVVSYYEKFLSRFPDVFRLSESSWTDFLPYYQGLGYYRRGENMLKTAKILVEKYNGVFPHDRGLLLELPGVGEYTASAILSFAYGKKYLAFDTNHKKVFGRYLKGSKNADVDVSEISSQIIFPFKSLNAGIMDFAGSVCKKKPKCGECPLATQCLYSQRKGRDEFVLRSAGVRADLKGRGSFPTKKAQVFLWLHQNHQEYFSPDPDAFSVFVLDKTSNTRNSMKEYFMRVYGLAISVRPPHLQTYVQGVPTLFVRAQILEGQHDFGVFSKEDVREFNESLGIEKVA